MSLQQTIRRILREEVYSPEGKKIKPKKFVIHKSEKRNRKSISKNGLIPKVGFCYKTQAGTNKCKPAIFATNSSNQEDWFAQLWDGDVWEINTEMIPDVVWYRDTHRFADFQTKHILTFDEIPPEALNLIQKGTE